MMLHLSNFTFVGDRSYIQGSQMIDELLTAIPGTQSFSARFHKVLKSQGYYFKIENVDDTSLCCTTFKVKTEQEMLTIGLTPYCNRTAYRVPEGYLSETLVSKIVQTTKKEHNKCLQGPWILVRLDLDWKKAKQGKNIIISPYLTLNGKLTKSDIMIDGKDCGEIYFTRRKI